MNHVTIHHADRLNCADKELNLRSPKIMGILNLTPDSLYEGGQYSSADLALARVQAMIDEGADIIDVGAESSRPYATSISLGEEIDRIIEVLSLIKAHFDVIVSVDTYKAEVMQEAIKMGVDMINDIYALQKVGSLDTVANSQVAVCLMHMQGSPDTMQDNPTYLDVVSEVSDFLVERVNICVTAGIARDRIIIDPGFGFGKTTAHNLHLLRNLNHFKKMGLPILAGISRKASIGEILSAPVEDRLYGSLAAHTIAILNGANIIRTHDIKPTAHALKIARATLEQD